LRIEPAGQLCVVGGGVEEQAWKHLIALYFSFVGYIKDTRKEMEEMVIKDDTV